MMTFTKKEVEHKDSPDGKAITGRLVRKQIPVWENGKKTDKVEERIVLQMVIDSISECGIDNTLDEPRPCEKIWEIKNPKLRNMFRVYAENDLLDKKMFVFEVRGELMKQNYQLVALDKKK